MKVLTGVGIILPSAHTELDPADFVSLDGAGDLYLLPTVLLWVERICIHVSRSVVSATGELPARFSRYHTTC